MNPKPQRHVRSIKRVGKKELIAKLTFYPSNLPKSEEKLWEVIGKDFPLIPRENVSLVKQLDGTLDVVPSEPQPKPESLVHEDFVI